MRNTHTADAASTAASMHPDRGMPIGLLISIGVIASMLVVAATILLLGWNRARSALMDTAQRTAHDTGQLINARARVLLEPTQSTLRQISFDPIADASTLTERLQRLYVLSEELSTNPMISAIYVGYDNGEFLLARPLDNAAIRERFKAPGGANFLVQTRTLQPGGNIVGEYLFFDANSVIEERRAMPDYQFDARVRPWYRAANETTDSVLSQPYVFFTTQQVGVTLSRLSRSGNAVVGIDMVLDEISSTLGTLKLSDHSEIALVNDQQEILAYPQMDRVLVRGADGFSFKKVGDFDSPDLLALHAAQTPLGKVHFFEVGGREILGVRLPFDVWAGTEMHLLVTAPVEDMLGSLPQQGRNILWAIAALLGALLPLGWWAGSRIGHSLDSLSAQAVRIGHFEFSDSTAQGARIREVNHLHGVMRDMSATIQSFLQLSHQMAVESDVERMLNTVLRQLVSATRCSDAAVYLWDADAQCVVLHAVASGDASKLADRFAYEAGRVPRDGTCQAAHGELRLELELRGRNGQLQGLLTLMQPEGSAHLESAFVEFARQLSGSLAVSIETRQLIDAQKKLLDAVIRLMADAIDAKSPYTGGHCEHVPELATMLVDHLNAQTSGPYADFRMSEEERYEFYLGAWLHDCGKVTSPEHIVDKATKLEVIYNRIHEVRMRFEVLWRDAEIAHLQRLGSGGDPALSQAARDACHRQLTQDFAFVAECNVGGEFMADAALARLRSIAQQTVSLEI